MAVILHVRSRTKSDVEKKVKVQLIIIHPDVGYEVEVPLGEWQQLLLGGNDIIAPVTHHWEIDNTPDPQAA